MKFIAILFALVSSQAYAANIGPAGCGLGNQVMGTESQVLASTTNGTSGNQTFGITSGTSNCVDSGRMAMIENYIDANKVALSTDAARGQGEAISNLSNLMGCDASSFGGVVKSNYKSIFHSDETSAITSRLMIVVDNNAALAKCGS